MAVFIEGFYTALGTPIDPSGQVLPESLARQVCRQVDCGASGLLLMGSMGMQPCMAARETGRAAASAAEANAGRVPLFVGVMDNSILGVMERVTALKGLTVDGVVLTAPFYFKLCDDTLADFFLSIADRSPLPVYLYDLPGVVKHTITFSMARKLAAHPNVVGIKSANFRLHMQIVQGIELKKGFTGFYSDLDTMDTGWRCGLRRVLDGMFACAPKTAQAMCMALAAGDYTAASAALSRIVVLRDLFARHDIFAGFTVAMNALGCKGSFAPDYSPPIPASQVDSILAMMDEMGEV